MNDTLLSLRPVSGYNLHGNHVPATSLQNQIGTTLSVITHSITVGSYVMMHQWVPNLEAWGLFHRYINLWNYFSNNHLGLVAMSWYSFTVIAFFCTLIWVYNPGFPSTTWQIGAGMLMLMSSTSYPALRGFHSGGGITWERKKKHC